MAGNLTTHNPRTVMLVMVAQACTQAARTRSQRRHTHPPHGASQLRRTYTLTAQAYTLHAQ
jgi:hypothetical protein